MNVIELQRALRQLRCSGMALGLEARASSRPRPRSSSRFMVSDLLVIATSWVPGLRRLKPRILSMHLTCPSGLIRRECSIRTNFAAGTRRGRVRRRHSTRKNLEAGREKLPGSPGESFLRSPVGAVFRGLEQTLVVMIL